MSIVVELFLRDRIVRGELGTRGQRALDLFNRPDAAIHLRDAQVASFHTGAPPRPLGAVRVDKAQVLLVAPEDGEHLLWPRLRAHWVPTARVQAEAGVGPIIVSGTFHVGRSMPLAMSNIFLGAERRLFVPVTEATLSSECHAGWSVQRSAVFIPRQHVEYVTLPQLERTLDDEVEEDLMPLELLWENVPFDGDTDLRARV